MPPTAFWARLRVVAIAVTGLGCASAQNDSADGLAASLDYLVPENVSKDAVDYGPATCELPAHSGLRVGVCRDDVEKFREELDFCRDAVRYRACVPADQPLWPSWNATAKDDLLKRLYKQVVERRLLVEANLSTDTYVDLHILSNAECMVAFKNALCWYNFPKCSDQNVSLPLCRTSCNRYYKACNYLPFPKSGQYDQCSDQYVKTKGLFGMNVTGPEQTLGDNSVVCESTKALADSIPDDEGKEAPWYTTWWGILLLALGGCLVVYIVSSLLLPYGIRAYLKWFFPQVLLTPIRLWERLPMLSGRMLFGILAMVVLALAVFGGYRRVVTAMPNGFERFYDIYAAQSEGISIGFNPDLASRTLHINFSLTNHQLKQVVATCSCTGDASHLFGRLDAMVFVLLILAAAGVVHRPFFTS